MELALGVSILGLQLVIVGWLLSHTSQCNKFHERVASLEERVKNVEDER